MGKTADVFLSLLIPAAVSLLLFFMISYIVVPLWQRYRGRYSRYVPLESINTHTSSVRQRVQGLLAGFFLLSIWRTGYQSSVDPHEGSEDAFDEEDGEELFEIPDGRREALSLDERRGCDGTEARLTRDLEEGFRDDSDNGETAPNATRSGRQA